MKLHLLASRFPSHASVFLCVLLRGHVTFQLNDMKLLAKSSLFTTVSQSTELFQTKQNKNRRKQNQLQEKSKSQIH